MKDPTLPRRMKRSLSRFMAKAARMYMRKVRSCGQKDLWGMQRVFKMDGGSSGVSPEICSRLNIPVLREQPVLPAYFYAMRRKVGAQTDPLVQFIE